MVECRHAEAPRPWPLDSLARKGGAGPPVAGPRDGRTRDRIDRRPAQAETSRTEADPQGPPSRMNGPPITGSGEPVILSGCPDPLPRLPLQSRPPQRRPLVNRPKAGPGTPPCPAASRRRSLRSPQGGSTARGRTRSGRAPACIPAAPAALEQSVRRMCRALFSASARFRLSASILNDARRARGLQRLHRGGIISHESRRLPARHGSTSHPPAE